MHVLTKIFIVLVSLLAVAIVPLVAVHATNEGTFKSRWLDESDRAAVATKELAAAQSARVAAEASANDKLSKVEHDLELAKRDAQAKVSQVRELETNLAAAKAMQAEIRTDIGIIRSTGDANQKMTAALVDEARGLRSRLVELETNYVQLDASYSEIQAQLDVADAARKALQEELQRLTEEKLAVKAKLDQYVATYGAIGGETVVIGTTNAKVPADRDLTATVIDVRQGLAEIDAGSRDGVKEGWSLTVGENGSFIALIRIINVDVNRATGVIEREKGPAKVQIGQKARATRGE